MLSTFISFLEKKVVLSGWGKVMGVSWGEVEVMCINSRVIIKLNSRILLWIMNLVGSYLNRWSILGLFFVFGSMTFRSLYNCTLKTGTRLQNYFFFLLKFINRGGRHWRQEVRHFLVSLASRTTSCTTWRWWKPCLIRFLSRNIFVLFFHNSKSAKSLCLEFPLSVRLKLAVNSPSHQIKHWRRM